MGMAAEYDQQAAAVANRRAAGRRSNYEETMYILDLGLDNRSADLPAKPVPWDRFESTLKELGCLVTTTGQGRLSTIRYAPTRPAPGRRLP